MRWLSLWSQNEPDDLIEQDADCSVVSREDSLPDVPNSFSTGLGVCHWCDGPASSLLDDCCTGCLDKLKWRAARLERPAWRGLRIDFY